MLLISVIAHEYAHGYAALKQGDKTALAAGRLTWNPIKHIDPVGTILIPVVLFFIGSPFLFGYAKPVPVDFGNLRKPKRDMAWVALAGPAANLVMALGWLVLAILLGSIGVTEVFFMKVAEAGVWVNLVIFAFNLVPVPPLDGGRIMTSLLPHKYAYKFAQLEPYGFFIVMGLVFFKVLHFWMIPVMSIARTTLLLIVSPLNFLLG